MKMDAFSSPEKEADEMPGRFHGYYAGPQVMTEQQGRMFERACMHSIILV